jgi:predicted component of type VI protein secretion system
MSVPNQDFEVHEGSTITVNVPLTQDGAPYVVPVGATVDWWASPTQFDASASVPIKKGLVVTTLGGQSTAAIPLQSADTIGRGQQKLFHQGRITLSGGQVVPLFSGTMSVIKRLVA